MSQDRLTRAGYTAQMAETAQSSNDSGSEYQPSEIVAPSLVSPTTCTSKKSSQKLFVDNEYDDFCELFKDLIQSKKPISKQLVKERLEGSPNLRHLLKKCTLLQLADKVRTERKRHTA